MNSILKPLYLCGVKKFKCAFAPGYIVQPANIFDVISCIEGRNVYGKPEGVLIKAVLRKTSFCANDELYIRSLFEFLFWGMPEPEIALELESLRGEPPTPEQNKFRYLAGEIYLW